MTESRTKDERTRRKELAKYMYVNDSLSQKEIASKIGVSENTLSKWIKTELWETLKSSVTITRQAQLSRLYGQIAAVNQNIIDNQNGMPTSKDADILAKISIAIRKMEAEASIADVVEVSRRMLEWLRPIQPKKAIELGGLFDEYINEQLKGR